MNKLKKIIFRLWRILSFRKGIYGNIGKKNRFCHDVYMNERTKVGSYNYFGERVVMFNVRVGNYCSIANSVKLGELEHDLRCISTSTYIFGPKHKITKYSGILKPTIVEDDVWIGSNAIIFQGVTIHRGAVIGAGAIVTKDVPAYGIVTGIPAKVLRYRFDEKTISLIDESEWWTYKPEKARAICATLQKRIDTTEKSV